jgi:hypothetical protein
MPPTYTLQTALADLLLPTPTIDLSNGVIAQLTRYEYYLPYITDVNPQLNVPILYFNIVTGTITIGDTSDIGINNTDLFIADDWIVLNAIP